MSSYHYRNSRVRVEIEIIIASFQNVAHTLTQMIAMSNILLLNFANEHNDNIIDIIMKNNLAHVVSALDRFKWYIENQDWY